MQWLAICILVLVAIGVVLIGTIRINVKNGGQPTLDQLLDEALRAVIPLLVEAQNDSAAVAQVMNSLHELCMFKLESFASSDKHSQYTSSVLMSLALVNTLGDDRVDDNDMLFYMLYTTLGGIFFLLIIEMLTRQFQTHLGTVFALNKHRSEKSNGIHLLRANDTSEEYFVVHLQKKRAAKRLADNQVVFGGNKLELYEMESRIIQCTVQPSLAVLLVFLLYVLVGALLLHLIVRPADSLITAVFANFFYVTTTSSPKWAYLNNPDICQLLFLCVNLFVGCIVVCAANVDIGSALFSYLHDMFSTPSMDRQLQLENLPPTSTPNPHNHE